MKPFGRKLILILALVCVFQTVNAQEYKHDGNWWRALPYTARLAYIAGFIDGAVWVAVDKKIGNPFSSMMGRKYGCAIWIHSTRIPKTVIFQ